MLSGEGFDPILYYEDHHKALKKGVALIPDFPYIMSHLQRAQEW